MLAILQKDSYSKTDTCFMKVYKLANHPRIGMCWFQLLSKNLQAQGITEPEVLYIICPIWLLDDGWPESETCNCPALSKRCIEREKERVDVKE